MYLSSIMDFVNLERIATLPYVDMGLRSHERIVQDARESLDALVGPLALCLRDYLFLAAMGEARHSGARARDFAMSGLLGGARNTLYGKAINYAPELSLPALVEVFSGSGWGGCYGGQKWATICETALTYGRISDTLFVDRAIDAQHNGGCAFNKNEAAQFMNLRWDIDVGLLSRFLNARHTTDAVELDYGPYAIKTLRQPTAPGVPDDAYRRYIRAREYIVDTCNCTDCTEKRRIVQQYEARYGQRDLSGVAWVMPMSIATANILTRYWRFMRGQDRMFVGKHRWRETRSYEPIQWGDKGIWRRDAVAPKSTRRGFMPSQGSKAEIGYYMISGLENIKSADIFQWSFDLTQQVEFGDGILWLPEGVTLAPPKAKPVPPTIKPLSYIFATDPQPVATPYSVQPAMPSTWLCDDDDDDDDDDSVESSAGDGNAEDDDADSSDEEEDSDSSDEPEPTQQSEPASVLYEQYCAATTHKEGVLSERQPTA